MRSHRTTFTIAVTGISRACLARDWLLGRLPPLDEDESAGNGLSRHRIASGANTLDAVFVRPAREPIRATLLICHGIAETVRHWVPVQRLLAEQGAASLVFDYSGYGRSTGRIEAAQCERDTIAAYEHLQRLTRIESPAVLGFSLGSGIAAAVTSRIRPARLVLCAGFTSFRAAAHSVGVPVGLGPFIPPLWHAEESLRGYSLPILVVHGEGDRLFPASMGSELAACCGAEERIVPRISHTEPYFRPSLEYWGPIMDWIADGRTLARTVFRDRTPIQRGRTAP